MENNCTLHYLDNAATTQVLPEVAGLVISTLTQHWANPASLYRAGFMAETVLQNARQSLATALECKPKEVFFTCGGTQANAIALFGAARARKHWGRHIVSSGYEHPSVEKTLEILAEKEGFELTKIAPEKDGNVDIEKIANAVGKNTVLATAMHVNNETGAVINPANFAAAVKAKNPRTFVHADGVQGFCKLPIKLCQTQLNSYATSGHKLHAPKGVGALYLKEGSNILPLFGGGGQEGGLCPGTENTAYIAAFAKAVQMANGQNLLPHLQNLQSQLQKGLKDMGGFTWHSPQNAYAGIAMFSLPANLPAQVVLNFLDEEFGVCVSSGSACSGGAKSHTLKAMNVLPSLIDGALRVSFCKTSTSQNVSALLCGLNAATKKLARK